MTRTLTLLALVALVAPPRARAQRISGVARDSLHLGALIADATRADPRHQQLALDAVAADLHLGNINAEKLPSLTAHGQAQYQSDVTKIAVSLPGGQTIPTPPHDTYDAHLNAQELLLDPSRGARRSLAQAQLAASDAGVEITLFALRDEVTDAFFAVATLELQHDQLVATIADLDARRHEAVLRQQEGTALPSDTAMLVATLLQRRQDDDALIASRRAALARLSLLVGRPLVDSTTVALPDLAGPVAAARATLAAQRARPEYGGFTASRMVLTQQASLIDAQTMPQLSAFGRLGYGRPGLNAFDVNFAPYWLAGVEVQWTPWNWGTTRRQHDSLQVQHDILATNEAAFAAQLVRAVQGDLASIDQLDATLRLDDSIVVLREQIGRETAIRLAEHAVTTAEYIDRSTELLQARLARVAHGMARAQAQTHVLTTFGIEVP